MPEEGGRDTIRPYPLPRSTRAAVGDIILACADIDHLVSLALFKVAGLPTEVGFPIVGRMMIGQRLEKLKFLLDLKATKEELNEFDLISKQMKPIIKLRNTLAHGTYVGRLGPDLAFLITSEYHDAEMALVTEMQYVNADSLPGAARDARLVEKRFKDAFDVRPWHETSVYRLLDKKPDGRRALKKGISPKQKIPPRSSQA